MPYTFDMIEARDPSNPEMIASNALVTIFAPGDPTQTPLNITTTQGWPMANPIQVNAMGYGPAFMHETLGRVAWSGGEFTGFFTAHDSIKQEAIAAAESAEAARIAAEEAVRNTLTPTAEVVAEALTSEGPARDAVSSAVTAGTSNLALKPDNGARAIGKGELVINVKDFGAVGDGVTNDLPALQRCLAAAPEGSTIFFPAGNYFQPPAAATTEDKFLVIEKSGLTLTAVPGSATITNIQIYLKGSYGPYVNAQSILSGANTVGTITNHGLAVGDYFQILSESNAYSVDGGKWQLGSDNPTNGGATLCRFTEIHQVSAVSSQTSLTTPDLVTYNYKANTSGLTAPMPGVATSQIRKLHALQNVTISGLNFTSTGSSFRQIIGRACVNLTFVDCAWSAGDLPGVHVKLTDSLNTVFTRCKSTRHARDVGSGSSWNSFMIGGGCHKATFDNCDFVGEMQTIDFTPSLFNTQADIGFSSLTSASTVQYLKITNCTFTACGDAGTSHPGSYYFEYLNNSVMGGSTGVRARSRASIIKGNTFYTSRGAVALSAFCSNSVIEGNECVQIPSPVGPLNSFYIGISYNGVSSEINNGNFVENVAINKNRVIVSDPNPNTSGIFLTNGTLSLTDAQKVSLSFIVVSNNWIKNTSIITSNWVHGTQFFGNHFAGNTNRDAVLWCQNNTGRNLILENTFETTLTAAIAVKTGTCVPPVGTTYPFNTANRVAAQVGVYQAPNLDLTNWTRTLVTVPA